MRLAGDRFDAHRARAITDLDVATDAGRLDLALRASRSHVARHCFENKARAARHAHVVASLTDVTMVTAPAALIRVVDTERDTRRVAAEAEQSALDRRRDSDVGLIPAHDVDFPRDQRKINRSTSIEANGRVQLRERALVLRSGKSWSCRHHNCDDYARELHFVFHFQVLAGSNATVRRSSTFLSSACVS